MKNLTLLAFLFISCSIFAQDVNFFQGTWEEANAKAKAENKLIMVDAFTYWCGPCKMMDKTFFHNNEAVATMINTHFIAYKVECEHDFGIQFARKFRVMAYPSLLFFNADGQVLDRKMGFNADQDEFLSQLKSFVDMDQTAVCRFDAKNMQVPWPDFYINDFRDAADSTWKRNRNVDVNAWLDQQQDLFSEASWAVLARFNTNEKYSQYIVDNYATYSNLYKSEVNDKFNNILYNMVNRAAKESKPELFNDAVKAMQTQKPNDTLNLFYMQSYYYELTGDWKNYAATVNARITNPANKVQLGEINSFAWTIYEKAEDEQIVKMAIGWFTPFLATINDYAAMDTYAALLSKAKQFNEAEEWAIKAIEIGKAENTDISGTEKLLESIRASK